MARAANPELAESRKRQILDAAVACFRRRGFHQTSMNEICAESGLSAGAIYRYFPAKSEIIAALAAENRAEIMSLFDELEAGADIIEGVTAIGAKVYNRIMDRAPLIADLMVEAMHDPKFATWIRDRDVEMMNRFEAVLAAAKRQGRLSDEVDPAEAARGLAIMFDGLVMRGVVYGGEPTEVIRSTIRRMVRGVLAVDPAGAPAPVEEDIRNG